MFKGVKITQESFDEAMYNVYRFMFVEFIAINARTVDKKHQWRGHCPFPAANIK